VLATHLLDSTLDQQLQRYSGLPHAHYMILVILSEEPEYQLRMSDQARSLRYSPSRMSHAVASLERNGWIERRPTPTDRRGQLALLTDAGVAEVRARDFDHLTPDQAARLGTVCDALLPGLEDC
jgi:DNA-binding MarR family transcriptional regulator